MTLHHIPLTWEKGRLYYSILKPQGIARKVLKIQIDDIPPEGMTLHLDETSELVKSILDGLDLEKNSASLRFDLDLERQELLVCVGGKMSGLISLECSRCLEPVGFPLSEQFRFYLRPPLEPEGQTEDETELCADDLDYGFLEDSSIDVAILLQEQFVLALPSQPLCKPDCRGICQRCGAELNKEVCRCGDADIDPRFEVLGRLKLS